MARLIGVDLPRDKRLEVALTYHRDPEGHRNQR